VKHFDFSKVGKLAEDFFHANTSPALIVGAIRGGKLEFSQSFGEIDLEKKTAVDGSSIFPIASMTKSFVAASIMKLRDDRKLTLDSIAKDFVPQLNHDKRWDYLTVRDLLSHQSGLPYDDAWADRHAGISNDELSEIFARPFTYACEPREQYLYSNLGYMILGRIVSEASGRPLQQFVTEKLLKPLSLDSTVWGVGKGMNPELKRFARGYVSRSGKFIEELFADSVGDAGGFVGLRSSLKDLAVWVEFLCSAYHPRGSRFDSILASRSRREMQKGVVLIPDNTPQGGHGAYALGLRRHSCKVGWSVGHSGGLPGSGTHMRWQPELDVGVIALSNSTYCPVWNLCETVLDVLVDGMSPVFTPNELVAQRGQELIKLMRSGSEPNSAYIFASNFFKDCPPDLTTTLFLLVKKQIDLAKESAPHIKFGRGLSAEVYIGTKLLFRYSLAPHEEGRVQSVEVM
jgi:CubicO group peptidase (beta-lactamase class C family)